MRVLSTRCCVQLKQTSHAFAFGSAIVDAQIAGDDEYNLKYQDCFYTYFNWAVQEYNLKWNTMEPVQVYAHPYPNHKLYIKKFEALLNICCLTIVAGTSP